MNKATKYTYLITMPAKFTYYDSCTDPYDVDFISNPKGKGEQDTLDCFSNIYGQYWNEGRFKRIKAVKKLVDLYNYKLIEGDSRIYLKKESNTICLELIIETDALGTHLATILEAIDLEIEEGEKEFGMWVGGVGVRRHRWQHIKQENLVSCEHPRSKRLEIMKDKDGTIVEVRECSKCKKLFKLAIH